MLNPSRIEETYREFMSNLNKWVHEGIIDIDLKFLFDNDLLEVIENESEEEDPDDLTQYFDVIHGDEKATLYNEQFVVWIIPKMENSEPITYVLIAINQPDKAVLELVFTTRGVYNTPRHVLEVLQHFLLETLDTEATISSMEKK
jgi:hypothetical protein